MFNFIKRIRREGFVCGFGWKPKNAPQKTPEQLRAFCERELNRLEPKGIDFKEIVELPKPQIGCIAQNILDDLAFENFSKWNYPFEKMVWTHYYDASMEGKQYRLHFAYRDYLYGNTGKVGKFSVSMVGFEEFSFNDDEQKALSDAFEKILDHASELKKQNKIKEEKELLSKLFPNCP
jgi:hypothetical protein